MMPPLELQDRLDANQRDQLLHLLREIKDRLELLAICQSTKEPLLRTRHAEIIGVSYANMVRAILMIPKIEKALYENDSLSFDRLRGRGPGPGSNSDDRTDK